MLEAGGKTLLKMHVDRLRWSGCRVFVATTDQPADDAIEKFCQQENLEFFRGSQEDVLSRYFGLAQKFGLETIVRVTSDCPLIDGHVIAEALNQYSKLGASTYLTNSQQRTFPRGFDFEIFSMELLANAHKNAHQDFEREHVTPFIWKDKSGLITTSHFKREADASQFRLCVDEPADFALIQKLVTEYGCDKLNCEQIIAVLESHPELRLVNAHVEQKKN